MTPTTREAVERFYWDADIERYLSSIDEAGTGLQPVVLASDYDALLAEVEGLRRDAERYRFLRDNADRDDDGCPFIALNVWSGLSEDDDPDFLDCDTQWLTGERAETAIDAAIAAPSRGEEA